MRTKRSTRLKLCVVAFALAVVAGATCLWALSTEDRGRWLQEAAWTNNTGRAKLLVRIGTDVDFATGSGTALHGAASTGNIELMRFLVEHGATVDAKAKYGITPLWEARSYGRADAEQFLLAQGAHPDTSHINPP